MAEISGFAPVVLNGRVAALKSAAPVLAALARGRKVSGYPRLSGKITDFFENFATQNFQNVKKCFNFWGPSRSSGDRRRKLIGAADR